MGVWAWGNGGEGGALIAVVTIASSYRVCIVAYTVNLQDFVHDISVF